MKKFFPYILLCLTVSIAFTSCSPNSLEEDGLIIKEAITTKSNLKTLYISWIENATEDEKNITREEFMTTNPYVQLHAFYIDEVNSNRETWKISVSNNDDTTPIIRVKEKVIIGFASFEPF